MSIDISIKRIINAYYFSGNNWQRTNFAPRLYDGIALLDDGKIEYSFSDNKLIAKKGDIIFLPGNIPYSGKKLTDTVAFYVLDFECYSDNNFSEVVGASVYTTNLYDRSRANFAKTVDAWEKQYIDVNFKIKTFIYSVFCDVLRCDNNQKTQTDIILDYIYENIDDPSLSLKKLCEIFYISESQLRRNIHKQTGMNPSDYILKLRINKARNELTISSKSISDVSANCGFSSPYYFSKCFSKIIGITPSKYKKLTSIV